MLVACDWSECGLIQVITICCVASAYDQVLGLKCRGGSRGRQLDCKLFCSWPTTAAHVFCAYQAQHYHNVMRTLQLSDAV